MIKKFDILIVNEIFPKISILHICSIPNRTIPVISIPARLANISLLPTSMFFQISVKIPFHLRDSILKMSLQNSNARISESNLHVKSPPMSASKLSLFLLRSNTTNTPNSPRSIVFIMAYSLILLVICKM